MRTPPRNRPCQIGRAIHLSKTNTDQIPQYGKRTSVWCIKHVSCWPCCKERPPDMPAIFTSCLEGTVVPYICSQACDTPVANGGCQQTSLTFACSLKSREHTKKLVHEVSSAVPDGSLSLWHDQDYKSCCQTDWHRSAPVHRHNKQLEI